MRIKRIQVEGFRSIRNATTLEIEPSVTVIVGANDHGKSNGLAALMSLNPDFRFEEDRDLNWDCSAENGTLPHVAFELELSTAERNELLQQENVRRAEVRGLVAPSENDLAVAQAKQLESTLAVEAAKAEFDQATRLLSVAKEAQAASPGDSARTNAVANASSFEQNSRRVLQKREKGHSQATQELHRLKSAIEAKRCGDAPDLLLDEIPTTVRMTRTGTNGECEWQKPDCIQAIVWNEFVTARSPRVELIGPFAEVQDATTEDALRNGTNEFMKGIFFYAGLEQASWAGLFEQNDKTSRRLEDASARLNVELKKTWSQGNELEFRLQHNSRLSTIELLVKDPAVRNRFVRASRRSSGFTHYFALKTILHAREKQHPAASYVWVFDEPGIYLHPSGQHDLIHELETLAKRNQVVYSTHSLFMLNKNFPARHRLVVKSSDGTAIRGKPFAGRWSQVLDALGFCVNGTILFASYVIIVEGDSDCLMLGAALQRLIAERKIDLDLNAVAFISAQTSAETRALLNILSQSMPAPRTGLLLDGDDGGKKRARYLDEMIRERSIPCLTLRPDGTTTEDHVPLAVPLYVRAATTYLEKCSTDGLFPAIDTTESITSKVQRSFQERFPGAKEGEASNGLAQWSRDFIRSELKWDQASKSGIAREYARCISDVDVAEITPSSVARLQEIATWLRDIVGVPGVADSVDRVFKDG